MRSRLGGVLVTAVAVAAVAAVAVCGPVTAGATEARSRDVAQDLEGVDQALLVPPDDDVATVDSLDDLGFGPI